MKKLTQQNKGITLIALVITIIVLLILAAVSIATLTGENGILTKATDAKENTEIAEEKEQIRLAYSAALANNKDNFEVTVKDLGDELAKLTSEATVSENEDGFTVTFTKSTVTRTYTVDSKGNVSEPTVSEGQKPEVRPEDSWGTLASQIEAGNYGDVVAYDIDLDGNEGTNDWKIFYKDESNNVFLIAADYLDYSINENEKKLDLQNTKLNPYYKEKNGKYSLNWSRGNLPEVKSDGINNDLFMSTEYDVTKPTHSSNPNAKCVSALLNTNYWSNFVNPSYADKAIGSPTLEMWVASWNDKGKTEKGSGKYTQLTETASESDYGYKINSSNYISLSSSGSSDNQTGYHDRLYFPHQEGVNSVESIGSGSEPVTTNETIGYWLASPSANDDDCLCRVGYSGDVVYDNYYNGGYGVRPIVSLKSDIKGNQESGVWKLATQH